MARPVAFLLIAFLLPLMSAKSSARDKTTDLTYTADGQMKFPERYREWVFLSSGLGMSYTPGAAQEHPAFDNVFVNPSSYSAFLKTGTWPDKTVLVLEIRASETHASIDQRGQSQSPEVRGIEVHVKDAGVPGGWGFFEFGAAKTAKITPRPASCYTCHEAHAAVDTTFVQFYPTLIGVAREKKTLSPAFLKEMPQAALSTSTTAKP